MARTWMCARGSHGTATDTHPRAWRRGARATDADLRAWQSGRCHGHGFARVAGSRVPQTRIRARGSPPAPLSVASPRSRTRANVIQ